MRGTAAGLLVVLATFLTPLGVTATWLSSTVDNTDAYVDTVAPLADDDELRAELSDAVSEAAVASLQEHVPVGLPAGIEAMTREAAVRVVENEGFPEFWRQANRDAHREFLAVMAPGAPAVPEGWIVVDVSPLLQQVYDRVAESGVPVQLLPEPELSVPLVGKARVAEYREEYRTLEGMAIWLPIVWAVLVGLAVLVAPGWRARLRTLGFAGIGLALGALLVRLTAGPVADLGVDSLDPGQQDLAGLIAGVVIDPLRSTAALVAVVAGTIGVLLVAAGLWPRRPAAPYHPSG